MLRTGELPPLKDYQARGLEAIESFGPGSSVLAVAPPGAGKSRCMLEHALKVSRAGGRVLIKAHRRMLLNQLTEGFQRAGISHGVIAAGFPEYERAPIQIAMAQTLYSRAIRYRKIELPKFDLVINDEAHQQASDTDIAMTFGTISGTILTEGFLSAGAQLVGYTATPLLKSRIYHNLVELASYSQLRDEKMHQLVHVVGPEEIDVTGLKENKEGEYSERGLAERVEVIFGSVFNEYLTLNPMGLPAILFAPSVPSSRWFCAEFNARGVSAAHIDGESCVICENGKLKAYPSDDKTRAAILEGSRSGDIKVVCNRFVLREAVDMPWLYHAIFATVMGSPTTYLQSVGRLQRFWPEYSHKLLQCHGGSYWRHGSPNDDRIWRLGLTNTIFKKERIESVRKGEKPEGIRCEFCGFWRKRNDQCYRCLRRGTISVREVRMADGTLKVMRGRVYNQRMASGSEQDSAWRRCLFACGRTGKPVSTALAMLKSTCKKHNIAFEPEQLRITPPSFKHVDYSRKVSEVYPWTSGKKKGRKVGR